MIKTETFLSREGQIASTKTFYLPEGQIATSFRTWYRSRLLLKRAFQRPFYLPNHQVSPKSSSFLDIRFLIEFLPKLSYLPNCPSTRVNIFVVSKSGLGVSWAVHEIPKPQTFRKKGLNFGEGDPNSEKRTSKGIWLVMNDGWWMTRQKLNSKLPRVSWRGSDIILD
jgi:hypothetical protein